VLRFDSFVVLSSVGAHPRAQRMASTDERTMKPDILAKKHEEYLI